MSRKNVSLLFLALCAFSISVDAQQGAGPKAPPPPPPSRPAPPVPPSPRPTVSVAAIGAPAPQATAPVTQVYQAGKPTPPPIPPKPISSSMATLKSAVSQTTAQSQQASAEAAKASALAQKAQQYSERTGVAWAQTMREASKGGGKLVGAVAREVQEKAEIAQGKALTAQKAQLEAEQNLQNQAATKIQALIRGYQARKGLEKQPEVPQAQSQPKTYVITPEENQLANQKTAPAVQPKPVFSGAVAVAQPSAKTIFSEAKGSATPMVQVSTAKLSAETIVSQLEAEKPKGFLTKFKEFFTSKKTIEAQQKAQQENLQKALSNAQVEAERAKMKKFEVSQQQWGKASDEYLKAQLDEKKATENLMRAAALARGGSKEEQVKAAEQAVLQAKDWASRGLVDIQKQQAAPSGGAIKQLELMDKQKLAEQKIKNRESKQASLDRLAETNIARAYQKAQESGVVRPIITQEAADLAYQDAFRQMQQIKDEQKQRLSRQYEMQRFQPKE